MGITKDGDTVEDLDKYFESIQPKPRTLAHADPAPNSPSPQEALKAEIIDATNNSLHPADYDGIMELIESYGDERAQETPNAIRWLAANEYGSEMEETALDVLFNAEDRIKYLSEQEQS